MYVSHRTYYTGICRQLIFALVAGGATVNVASFIFSLKGHWYEYKQHIGSLLVQCVRVSVCLID